MAGYKNNKIMLPIKEFLIVKGQATYELNTIDMTKATVFYRKYNQEAFLETYSEMPKGDYRINEVGGNKQLEITNLDILDKYYSIQLCRVVDLTSSPYNPSGQVDPITINQHLNEVIADVTFLFTYLKDVGMVMDSSGGNKILAELKPYTTWYMDENGNMAAMPVNSLFEKFNNLVEELRKEVLKLLEQDLEVAERELLEEIKRQLDEYLETTLKQRLDDYATTLEERLQAMIDQAVADKGLMPEGSDWFEIELGNWLVTDLFNKNYTNYPPELNLTDNAGVVKKDITDGGKSQIIRYYTTTGKMFFAVKVNEVWSEWQELGEQTDAMQFTQANHGFVFTAVTLDGATRQWVKSNKYTGADGIAVKVDNDRFDVVTRGIVNIPTQARDDKGEVFVYDEYYFLSQEVDGGLSRTKNEIGTFQYLAHISELDGKQVAYIDIGDSYDLDYDIVDTETADRVGIGTYKTTLRTANTIEDLKQLNLKEGDVVEVLGYYTKGDGADHKRKIESSDDGSGVLLSNGLWANLLCDDAVDLEWFGIKSDYDNTAQTVLYQKWIDYVNKTVGKFFTAKARKTYIIHKPLLIEKSFICSEEKAIFMMRSDYARTLASETEAEFRVSCMIAIKASMGETSNRIIVRNLTLKCTSVDDDTTDSTDYGVYFPQGSNFELSHIVVVRPNVAGFKFKANWMGTMHNLVSWSSRGKGFEMIGTFTSLHVSSCYSNSSKKIGWEINGANYCEFEGLACDHANIYSYSIGSCWGTNFKSLGSERADVKSILYLGDFNGSIEGVFTIGCNISRCFCEIFSDSTFEISGVRNNNLSKATEGVYSYITAGKKGLVTIENGSIQLKDGSTIFPQGYTSGMRLFFKNNRDNRMSEINAIIGGESSYLLDYELKEILTYEGFKVKPLGDEWYIISTNFNSNNIPEPTSSGFVEKVLPFQCDIIYPVDVIVDAPRGEVAVTWSRVFSDRISFKYSGNLVTGNILFVVIARKNKYSKINKEKIDYDYIDNKINFEKMLSLNTPYHTTKMAEEGGTTLTDFYSYLDKKNTYDKQLQQEQQAKYESYQQALKYNPNLTYEEFEKTYSQPMVMARSLSLTPKLQEPTIPQSVQDFMKKYL